MITIGGLFKTALYPRRQDDGRWRCEFIIQSDEAMTWQHRGSADGAFDSKSEAEQAAINKAKLWIDIHLPL